MRSDTCPSTKAPHIGAQCTTLPAAPATNNPKTNPPCKAVSEEHNAPSQCRSVIIVRF